MKRAFTLVELLIVVSIISILAVIAIPNFQDAQTRAKVSATKNNLRVMATNLEICAVDTNRYPRAITWNLPCKLVFDLDELTSGVRSFQLDPFLPYEDARADLPFGDLVYFHHRTMLDLLDQRIAWEKATTETWTLAYEMAGEWSLHSVGPDRVLQGPNWVQDQTSTTIASSPFGWCNAADGSSGCTSPPHEYTDWAFFRDYDPTNGTVSEGNIFRTQRSSSGFGVDPYFYREEKEAQ